MTRRTLDGKNPDGWVPEQKITVEEALRAYTSDAAFASPAKLEAGTLERGKLADFVMIDRDLTRVAPELRGGAGDDSRSATSSTPTRRYEEPVHSEPPCHSERSKNLGPDSTTLPMVEIPRSLRSLGMTGVLLEANDLLGTLRMTSSTCGRMASSNRGA